MIARYKKDDVIVRAVISVVGIDTIFDMNKEIRYFLESNEIAYDLTLWFKEEQIDISIPSSKINKTITFNDVIFIYERDKSIGITSKEAFLIFYTLITDDNNPLNTQVAGNHYKDFKIQPVEFILANNIPYIEGNVIKYVCRHEKKKGSEDIEKAIHYLKMLLKLKYGIENGEK